MKLKTLLVHASTLAIVLIPVASLASTSDGAITTAGNALAWSSKCGWLNFNTANGGVRIRDSGLTGYAWSTQYGWVNLAPASAGVTVDSNGNLGGHAWGVNCGWIGFSGTRVDNNGVLRGSATTVNQVTGGTSTLNFDCTTCTSITTDYRASATRTTPPSSGGGGVSAGPAAPPAAPPAPPFTPPAPPVIPPPPPVAPPAPPTPSPEPPLTPGESAPTPPPTPQQFSDTIKSLGLNTSAPIEQLAITTASDGIVHPGSDTVAIRDFGNGVAMMVEIPKNTFDRPTRLDVRAIPVEKSSNANTISFYASIFDVRIRDNDTGEEIHKFKDKIKISLSIPKELRGRNDLGLYYLTKDMSKWIYIPDVKFGATSLEAHIDHLTRFAIFVSKSFPSEILQPVVLIPFTEIVEYELFIKKALVKQANELSLHVALLNNLERPTKINFSYVIKNERGTTVFRKVLGKTVTAPGYFEEEFPSLNLPNGKYMLIVEALDGANLLKRFQRTINVNNSLGEQANPWVLALINILLALVVVYLGVRYYNARKTFQTLLVNQQTHA